MSDYNKTLREISHLKSMVPGLLSFNSTDWKEVWKQVKVVGAAFKGVRFPSREEHQKAWDDFQRIVDEIKEKQSEERKEKQKAWDAKSNTSAFWRDKIIRLAQDAKPYRSTGLEAIILAIATGGLSIVLEMIMGPFDDRKSELQSASESLKQGFSLLSERKQEIMSQDKGLCFDALNEAKDYLDREWTVYKEERQKAWDTYQGEKQQKHQTWKNRTEDNLRKLEERRDKLASVLAHKESHLNDLQDKLSDARSDSYRDRVSGWIDEEKENIEEIQDKLRNVLTWIEETEDKLRS